MPKVRRRSSSSVARDRDRASPYPPCTSEDAERDKSNCLDQFCRSCANTRGTTLPELPLPRITSHSSVEEKEEEEEELFSGETSPYPTCPLCRGRIYGYIVVHSARRFMNHKVRSCSSETCEFTGSHSELRKHVKSEHPNVAYCLVFVLASLSFI